MSWQPKKQLQETALAWAVVARFKPANFLLAMSVRASGGTSRPRCHGLHLPVAMLLFVSVCASAAEPQAAPAGLATFTLVRGGTSAAGYESFVNSRRCLREGAIPSWLIYDDIAFHEGNVPRDMQSMLRQRV